MTGPWHEGPLVGFDTETTGTDTHGDRIVSAAVVFQEHRSAVPLMYEFLIDPGVEIPEGATKVHGISTEMARNDGVDPVQALNEIGMLLGQFVEKGAGLVAYNAPFDLTLYRQDCIRNGVVPSAAALNARVVDPLVIDKQTDKFRKGSRKLADVAAHFGVPNAGAHGALADVIMTMRIARALPDAFPPLAVDLATLHNWQRIWKAQQDASYVQYKRRTDPGFSIETAWPIEEVRVEQQW